MTTTERPLLVLSGLAVAPDESRPPVLRDIDLQVRPGEMLAVVGQSGAGKTTLLRTINGQLRARSGRVVLAGRDLTQLHGRALRETRREIGYVAQKHDLVEPLRVHENVMAGALGRWSTARALRYLCHPTQGELSEAAAALTAVGLGNKLHARTSELSGGEQQRVAIARALVQAPKLLLADEPIASLDPVTAEVILELLIRVAGERGMAVICSLHQPELARRYFDAILIVEGGTLHRSAHREGACLRDPDPLRRATPFSLRLA